MGIRTTFALVVTSLSVAACGGGGGGGDAPSGGTTPPPAVTLSVNAGSDLQSVEGTVVQLAGSGSASNGGSVTYAWAQTSGPTVTLSNASVVNPTFTAPDVPIGYPDTLDFRLTVNGPGGVSASDSVTINVGPMERLFFRAADSGEATRATLYRFDLFPPTQTRLSNTPIAGGEVKSFLLSPDGQYVAYLANEESLEQDELFLVSADGGPVVKISPALATAGDVFDVSWAPDSSRLLFIAEVFADNVRDLYVHDVAAAETTLVNSDQLTANGGYAVNPEWSPDGQSISYFEVDPTQTPVTGVRVHDVSDLSQPGIRITEQPLLAASPGVTSFEWKPDSSGGYFTARIIGGQPPQLFSVGRDGTGFADLGVPGATRVTVSPDGAHVASVADHDQDGAHSIFIVRSDGVQTAQVDTTPASGHNVGSLAWSPDGQRLAFYESGAPNGITRGLYTLRTDGTERARITIDDTANGLVTNFGWSPDGTAIAFRENTLPSTYEIFVADADGSNVTRLSRNPVEAGRATQMEDGTAIWSPDSQRVTYRGEYDDDGLLGMYTARRNGGSRLLVSTKPLAFRGGVRAGHSWATNTEGVAFVSAQETSNTYDLFYTSENSAVTGKATVSLVAPGQVFDDFTWAPSQ